MSGSICRPGALAGAGDGKLLVELAPWGELAAFDAFLGPKVETEPVTITEVNCACFISRGFWQPCYHANVWRIQRQVANMALRALKVMHAMPIAVHFCLARIHN
jgi:hypothetical protein